jgi:hypothetical protein
MLPSLLVGAGGSILVHHRQSTVLARLSAAFCCHHAEQLTCVAAWAQPVSLWDLLEYWLQAAHVEAPQAGGALKHGIGTAAPAAGAHLQAHTAAAP